MPNNEVEPLPLTIYKNNSKIIKDPNVRTKTVKLLEENMSTSSLDLSIFS